MERKHKDQGAPLARLQRILREARARIVRGWTQGHSARKANGQYVDHEAPEAVQWCIYGAVAYDSDAICALAKVVGRRDLGCWNDDPQRTQAEVLAALDKTITDAPKAPEEVL